LAEHAMSQVPDAPEGRFHPQIAATSGRPT
jgi:hypothetical protein